MWQEIQQVQMCSTEEFTICIGIGRSLLVLFYTQFIICSAFFFFKKQLTHLVACFFLVSPIPHIHLQGPLPSCIAVESLVVETRKCS